MLRLHTAGESHGPALTAILEGIPRGLTVPKETIDAELRRRQMGYGRGGRMKLEHDEVVFLGGLRHGVTLGTPLALQVVNRNHEQQWKEVMSPLPPSEPIPEARMKRLTRPRPGHADLAGGLKYGARDLREVLERASARETAVRVAAGAIAKLLLRELGIEVRSHVLAVGSVTLPLDEYVPWETIRGLDDAEIRLRCVDAKREEKMVAAIDAAREAGDTLGGIFEVVAHTPPPGLGSHTQWDLRLDGRLAQAILSIPAVKACAVGLGVEAAGRPGSLVHDAIHYQEERGFHRTTNRAGGLEGGMTNGEELRIRGFMKPISTMRKPIESVDIETREATTAAYERSDITAVPAAGVIGESMVALILTAAVREKLGGDSMTELTASYDRYRTRLSEF